MKIAINTLSIGSAGGKDYAAMLIRSLAEIDKENDYVVILNPAKKEIISKKDNFEYIYKEFNYFNVVLRFLWEQLYLPFILRKKKVDLLYNLSGYDIFFAPCKTIIKIGNMEPFINAKKKNNFKNKLRLKLLRLLGCISFYSANSVIIMSKTAQQELIRMFPVLGNKSYGILHSADLANLGQDKKTLDDNNKKYIFCVSNILSYKCYLELFEALDVLINKDNLKDLLLRIAGGVKDAEYFRSLKKIIDTRRLYDNIEFLGFIPRNKLYNLYKNCRFLIFSSVVETCPRTLIEAMKCAIPILCSERSVMPEICQDAALYFNPEDPEDVAKKINMLMNDNALLEKLRVKSLERGKDFSWDKTVRKTLSVFEKIYHEK